MSEGSGFNHAGRSRKDLDPIQLLTAGGWLFPAWVYEAANEQARNAGREVIPVPPQAYEVDEPVPGPNAVEQPLPEEAVRMDGEELMAYIERQHPASEGWRHQTLTRRP